MASLSEKYLAEEKDEAATGSRRSKSSLTALIYIASSNLLPMLMATEHRIDRIPIVYLAEANA